MKKTLSIVAMMSLFLTSNYAFASNDIEKIKQQLNSLKANYEQRIKTLEARLAEIENKQQLNHQSITTVATEMEESISASKATAKQSDFNPAISLILSGGYAGYDNNPNNYQLPGFMTGNEAGLGEQGFSLGESEVTLSSNIDDKFYGQATLSFDGAATGTEVSVEEAFFQTTSLDNGLTIKGGRFFSAVGYLNEQHAHAWDFNDAPLVYRALFGDQLVNDGIQATYLLPTDQYMQIGAEVGNGSHFSGAGSHQGSGAWSLFYNVGGDIDISNSWQLGLNHWQSGNVKDRNSSFLDNTVLYNGDSKINSLDFVYKWAPNGNLVQQNFKLQTEYFDRREHGQVAITNLNEDTSYTGHQQGWYAEAIYQFKPQWTTGFRYDWLNSNNNGANSTALSDAGLSDSYSPKRYSMMLEWLPSEFSRFRLQYNRDESYQDTDNQLLLQYTFSLGTHGAHQY